MNGKRVFTSLSFAGARGRLGLRRRPPLEQEALGALEIVLVVVVEQQTQVVVLVLVVVVVESTRRRQAGHQRRRARRLVVVVVVRAPGRPQATQVQLKSLRARMPRRAGQSAFVFSQFQIAFSGFSLAVFQMCRFHQTHVLVFFFHVGNFDPAFESFLILAIQAMHKNSCFKCYLRKRGRIYHGNRQESNQFVFYSAMYFPSAQYTCPSSANESRIDRSVLSPSPPPNRAAKSTADAPPPVDAD